MILALTLVANPGPPSAMSMKYSVLSAGFQCSAKTETLVVCRNQAQLDSAVKQLGIRLADTVSVDFSNDMVLIVTGGEKPSAGYGLKDVGFYFVDYNKFGSLVWDLSIKPFLAEDGVDTAALNTPLSVYHWDEGDALVAVRKQCPPPGALVAMMITHPYLVLKVPSVQGQVKLLLLECASEKQGDKK